MSYIVPRDKPKRCTQPKCRFMDRNTLDCRLQGKSWESFEEQYEHCPLIEIPTPHGRLVDLDKMIDHFWDGYSMEVFKSELEQIQTVIEAEEKND